MKAPPRYLVTVQSTSTSAPNRYIKVRFQHIHFGRCKHLVHLQALIIIIIYLIFLHQHLYLILAVFSDLNLHDLFIIFMPLSLSSGFLDDCLNFSSILLLPFFAIVLMFLTVSSVDFYCYICSSVSVHS